jgi:S-adenosyl methyltransferase
MTNTPVTGEPAELDTSVAHPDRVYDYWLGGKDNFAADRAAAQQAIAANPMIVPGVRTNRAFLRRAVHYLAGDAGIRQFLDIGTGLPSANNTHQVAQAVAPDSRIVYVDNDRCKSGCAHTRLRSRWCVRQPSAVDRRSTTDWPPRQSPDTQQET